MSRSAPRCQVLIHVPLLLDHLQKVSVVHYLLEHGAERESIVPTEGRRETEDWYTMLDSGRWKLLVWVLDFVVKAG